METATIKFGVSGQKLTYKGGTTKYASNTIGYIFAEFDLDENWQTFDSVSAIWASDHASTAVTLGEGGVCEVPATVIALKSRVSVNLVGITETDGEVTSRMTTYPVVALQVEEDARIRGEE